MKHQYGFTLIELMIVVAIIGILAAIAVPAYQAYTGRAQMAEALTLTSGARTAVYEYHDNFGVWPPTNQAAGLASDASIRGKYVEKVVVNGPSIVAHMHSTGVAQGIASQTLTLATTKSSDGAYNWTCSSTVSIQYLPASCR